MSEIKENPPSYSWGIALLFLPSVIGLLLVFDLLPGVWWLQVAVVVIIVGCVGVGSYLAWWGKRPRVARGEWTPSETLPEDEPR